MPTNAKLKPLLWVILLTVCSQSWGQPNPVEDALQSDATKITAIMGNLSQHEVQVMFSEVLRGPNGKVTFNSSQFQLNEEQYFYPASTVKFPIALLALEKMAEDTRLNRNTRFRVDGDSETTTFAKEITELFVVSDNDAYNRLFEYLGKDDINRRLAEKGIKARISHRLSVPNSDILSYQPLTFFPNKKEITVKTDDSVPIAILPLVGLIKGRAYQDQGEIVGNPFDFSKKNYLPLSSLHSIMQRFIFPDLFEKEQRFQLSDSDRRFVLDAMKTLPAEAGYTETEYYDSYVKFFLFGDSQAAMPNHIEISNKVGYAYGTLTDCAYIFDKRLNKEYIISATVLVNENQTFNDDDYEYESVGIPFLAELGRQLVKAER